MNSDDFYIFIVYTVINYFVLNFQVLILRKTILIKMTLISSLVRIFSHQTLFYQDNKNVFMAKKIVFQ